METRYTPRHQRRSRLSAMAASVRRALHPHWEYHEVSILDVLAEDLKVGVAQDELLEFLFQTAQQYGMEPAQFLQGAQQAGQIPAFVSEVARNKSLAMALRQAAVVDSKGETVDLSAFIGSDEDDAAAAAQAAAVAAEGEDAE